MKKFQQISDFYSVSLKNQETHKVVIWFSWNFIAYNVVIIL